MTRWAVGVYASPDFKWLPIPTELVLKARDAIWFIALAASASGLPFAKRGDVEKTQRWALVMILLIIILGGTLWTAPIGPMMAVQTTLNNK